MSLYRRKGSRFWWSDLQIDGKRHHFTTRTANKNTARSIEAAKRTELVKGLAGLTSPTLNSFSTRFINAMVPRVSKQTLKFYFSHLQPLADFEPLFESRLDRIDASLIEEFVQWRRKQKGRGAKTVSTVTINHNLRTLRRALHLAAEWGVIAKAPKITLLGGEHQREYVLSDEAVKDFEKEESLIGKLVPFLVDTGLRRAEACALTWEAVHLPLHSIEVLKGKTKYSRRRIPLTKRAERILTELKATAKTEYVFTIRQTVHITGNWLSHTFLRVRRRLKLPNTCVLHSTRHTFCTRLGERGADAFAIQRLAGHSSIVISQRYVHPAAAKLDAAIALLE
jgi:integrase